MSALSASLAAAAAAARASETSRESNNVARSKPTPLQHAPAKPAPVKPPRPAVRRPKQPVKITVDTSVANVNPPQGSSATSAAAAAARSFKKQKDEQSPQHRPPASHRNSGESTKTPNSDSRPASTSSLVPSTPVSATAPSSTVAAAASAAAKRSSTFNKSVPTPVVSDIMKKEMEENRAAAAAAAAQEKASQVIRDLPSPSNSVRSKRLSQSSLVPVLSDEDFYSHRRYARSTQSFATIPTDEDSPGEMGDFEDNNQVHRERTRGIQSAAKYANRLSQASMDSAHTSQQLQPVVSPHTGLPQEGSVLAAALKAGSNASSTMERISLSNEAKEREKAEKRQRKDAKAKAKLLAQANAVYQQSASENHHAHHHQYHQGNIFKRVIGKSGKPIDPFQGFSPNFSERSGEHFHTHQREMQGAADGVRRSIDTSRRSIDNPRRSNDTSRQSLDFSRRSNDSSRELTKNTSPIPIQQLKSHDAGAVSDLPTSLDEPGLSANTHLQRSFSNNNTLQTVKSSTDDSMSVASMDSADDGGPGRPPLLAPIPIRNASIIPVSSGSESEDTRRSHRRHLSSSQSQRNSLQFPMSPTFSASPAKQLITPEQLLPKRRRGAAPTTSVSSSARRSSSPVMSNPLERSSTLQSTLQGSPMNSPVTKSPVFFEGNNGSSSGGVNGAMGNSPPDSELALTPSESTAHSYFAREYREPKSSSSRGVEGASRLAKKLPHRHLTAGGKSIVKSIWSKASPEAPPPLPVSTGGMKTSLRKQPKKKFNEDKPWKHHNDADTLTEAERKRYDGVWATNRGAHIPYFMEPEEYDILIDEEEFYDEGFLSDSDFTESDSDDDSVSSAEYIMSGENIGKDDVVVADQNDAVHGYIVSRLWRRSRLPDERLSSIWELVDRCNDGTLDREGFLVGMWLVDQCLYGRKLPNKVDPRVWGSVGRLNVNIKIRQKEPKRNSAKRKARRKLRRDRKELLRERERNEKERKKDEKKEKKDEKKERKEEKKEKNDEKKDKKEEKKRDKKRAGEV
ncbi:Increased rDNA silencing protein 4 [Yarrowia sp. C11]|nr:Increased rDNA silencing protein 4 [Yarrowia sp. C11]KAG5371028.1 Increased rDNA silencing protein 4 [Yarrowia sp. E02]